MTLQCKILEVMEIWPLQLACEAADGPYHVALGEDTLIDGNRRHHRDPGVLRPGMVIRVHGERSGARGIRAQEIEIVSAAG